jgi:hypothetical protein
MTTKRSVLLRTAAAAAFLGLGLGLAGCSMMNAGGGGKEVFQAALTPAQEVPPTTSNGSGQAEVTYDKGAGTLSWKVSYSGLSGPATGSHIHGPAAPGQNAGVLVPFTNVGTSPFSGEAKITPEQAAQLAAGQWYVNVHTAANPGGEIRGQLRRR